MKYRKKPIVIEAYHLGADQQLPRWLEEAILERTVRATDDGGFIIKTLEGAMQASGSDWIIQGVKGELYPCKPDIFEATYEQVKL